VGVEAGREFKTGTTAFDPIADVHWLMKRCVVKPVVFLIVAALAGCSAPFEHPKSLCDNDC